MNTHEIAARRAALSDEKRALLARRLRGEAAAPRPRETVTRVAGPGPEHPASFAQERMWFLDRFTPGSPMYNVPVAVLMRADVNVPLLERAYSEVVRRHESLRTTFFMGADGQLRQYVHEPFAVSIEVVECRHRVGERFTDDLGALVAEEGSRPFDLTRLPLFRVTLLRVSDEDFACVITMHHVVIDGWAYPLILRESVDLYNALYAGRPSPLPDPTLRYADYAVWQRGYLQGERLEAQVRYWRDSLAGAPPLDLPTDRPRPPVASYRGRFHRFRVDARVTGQLRELCREEAATLNMVIMAAFYVLLHRYSGQDDVVVGTLLGNRSRAELEQVVGVFVNTAALRMDLSGDPAFREVLRRTKAAVLGADAHQDLPFERLVDLMGVERDMSRHPLFQALYFHHTFVRTHRELTDPTARPALYTRPLDATHDLSLVDTGVSKFDLQLATVETLHGFAGKFEYSTDLFDAATIQRMTEHFRALLDRASADPDQPVSRIPLLADPERCVLGEWAAGPVLDASGAPLHREFEGQARRTPDAVAVVAGGERVTYRELDRWADRVAAGLRARGAGRGTVVGVLVERSAAMVAALLGAWKAGAAYLPLDPGYPAGRLGFMLADSGAALVVADDELAAALPDAVPVLVCPPPPGAGEAAERVDAGARDSDLAYLIYTSGSTGTPKAVEVEHRSAAAFLAAMRREPGIGADDVLLAVTTISFDISVLELFLPLTRGARVVIAGRGQAADAPALARLLEAESATVMQATPATWRMLVQSGWSGRPGLRALTGGEALTADLAEALLDRAGEVWNLYGPTETTVWSTAYRVREPGQGVLPIGRPLAGTRVYVLDGALQPCPVGVPGELFIGGAGVARGYRSRPGLTAERFVADPFAPGEGRRMYRTGDRVRWGADGQLRFMGRLDHQVKLRGHRIEPGEIESVLLRHPAVAQAVAVVREDAPGDARLAAYVVPVADADAPAEAELAAWVRERLPGYMVPSAFVTLGALPLAPSGKVDRRGLPAPEARDTLDPGRVAPRTVAEEMVSGIFAEVLRRDGFGVTDGFFALGGHSLMATQVLARVAQAFEVEIPIRDFFQRPTVAAVAAAVESSGSPVLAQMVGELRELSAAEIEALLAEAEA